MVTDVKISAEERARGLSRSLHILGVCCGLAAGAWLGGAEAPTKLVVAGVSPFVISLSMVAGVFVARWTVPTLLKGTSYVVLDLRAKAHLIVWAILAGALWAVANTLTVFAIRDVGLSIAFPLWNTNGVIGLFWGWLLFNELRGASATDWAKVLGGGLAIVGGACALAYATTSRQVAEVSPRGTAGILAALGAGLLWGTMYIPYRKAYLSGMNPLSFVTVFTVGELGTMATLALIFQGGFGHLAQDLVSVRSSLFWLFLGGFCWVIGDLFQQYAAKYLGIARGIPLSNTNQLWGLVWGVLVFGELVGFAPGKQALVVGGSVTMMIGAVAISFAETASTERISWRRAMQRECDRYSLDPKEVELALSGEDPLGQRECARAWWDIPIILCALAVFAIFGYWARRPPIPLHTWSAVLLGVVMLLFMFGCGMLLYKRTRFS
jgi:drug/metabolite transporter (DMT)-like permease